MSATASGDIVLDVEDTTINTAGAGADGSVEGEESGDAGNSDESEEAGDSGESGDSNGFEEVYAPRAAVYEGLPGALLSLSRLPVAGTGRLHSSGSPLWFRDHEWEGLARA